MVGGFTVGKVAVANWIVGAIFGEGDVMIDVQQPFGRVFPRGFASWGGGSTVEEMGGLRLSRSCCHRGMIPASNKLDNHCSRISLGRSVVDMDVEGKLLLRYEGRYVPGA